MVPLRVAWLGSTLLTRKTSSRRPAMASPTSSSASPSPYISAVSMRVSPISRPWRSAAISSLRRRGPRPYAKCPCRAQEPQRRRAAEWSARRTRVLRGRGARGVLLNVLPSQPTHLSVCFTIYIVASQRYLTALPHNVTSRRGVLGLAARAAEEFDHGAIEGGNIVGFAAGD